MEAVSGGDKVFRVIDDRSVTIPLVIDLIGKKEIRVLYCAG